MNTEETYAYETSNENETEALNQTSNQTPKVKIENHVPIPPSARKANIQLGELPFDDMEVGDSFLYPVDHDDARVVRALRVRASRQNKLSGGTKRFSVVQDEGGLRVFRTE